MPPKKKQWKPLNGAVDHSSFILPPKTGKPIIIKDPSGRHVKLHTEPVVPSASAEKDAHHVVPDHDKNGTSMNASTNDQHRTSDPPPAIPVADARLKHRENEPQHPTSPVTQNSTSLPQQPLMPTHAYQNVRHLVQNSNVLNVPHRPNLGLRGPSSGSTTPSLPQQKSPGGTPYRSNLDIYAHKYVPYWLRAVNESPAVSIYSQPLHHIDFGVYQHSFAAPNTLPLLPDIALPPTHPCHLYTTSLHPTTYEPFWKERLHNEYAAQHLQNLSFGLYNQEIREYNKQNYLYQVKVPGIREYAPRIDLGDVLRIRPLHPILEGVIAHQAQQWSQSRDGIAPGFSGIEHHAVVWSIIRRDELVILKLGKLMDGDPRYLRCNVIIPSQIHKNAPAWRVIDLVSNMLDDRSGRTWSHSILFPEASDFVMQKTLWDGNFSLKWFDTSLNTEQKKAVQAVTDNNYGVLPYLISGPPGTGKTKTLVETAMQLIQSRRSSDVTPHLLLCAPSDAAADTLLVRLSSYLLPEKLFRLNNWTRLVSEVPGEVRSYCYVDESTSLHSLPSFEKLMSYQIVVTSCRDANMLLDAGLSNDSLGLMTSRLLRAIALGIAKKTPLLHWTALLIDEAAQATEPETLIAMAVVKPAELPDFCHVNPQFVMAGDEFQLGPRLFSATVRMPPTSSPADADIRLSTPQLDISLFQRLFETSVYSAHPLSRRHGMKGLTQAMLPIPRPAFSNLIRNYRSHRAILTTSSHLFYADTLIAERPNASPHILSWPRWSSKHKIRWPVMFVQNTSEDRVDSVLEGDGTGAGSLVNFGEADIVLNMITDLLSWTKHSHDSSHYQYTRHMQNGNGHNDNIDSAILRQEDVIIMSPFRAQVNHLRGLFRSHNLHAVRIGPLEAFQGLESRIVVLCTTRTRLGQYPTSPRNFVDEDKSRGLGVIGEEKRFNVAMSRAKEGLIVVGSGECLGVTRDRCWLEFLDFAKRNGLVVGEIPSGIVGRGGTHNATIRGKLERAMLWAEGLAEDDDDKEDETHYEGVNGDNVLVEPGTRSGNAKFRFLGKMTDLDERMLDLQVDDQDEEIIRREEDEALDESGGSENDEEDHDGDGDESDELDDINGFSITKQEVKQESD